MAKIGHFTSTVMIRMSALVGAVMPIPKHFESDAQITCYPRHQILKAHQECSNNGWLGLGLLIDLVRR